MDVSCVCLEILSINTFMIVELILLHRTMAKEHRHHHHRSLHHQLLDCHLKFNRKSYYCSIEQVFTFNFETNGRKIC